MAMKTIRVAILGAGPAGLSAALWLKNLGFTPILIERSTAVGGMQKLNFLKNDWVLGQSDVTGLEVAENFHQHIQHEAIDCRVGQQLKEIARVNNTFHLLLNDKVIVDCDAIIIASGTRYVGREIFSACDGFSNIDASKVVEGPYAYLDLDAISSQRVLIVGAGDNAFENALMLLERNCHVSMLARSSPKAQDKFLDKVLCHNNFRLLERSLITCCVQKEDVLLIEIDGEVNCQLEVDRLHILAGYKANAKSIAAMVLSGLGDTLESDNNNFLVVDACGRTNIKHIYAAGDICNAQFPCVVSALASGALAAKTISQDLS
ncbi:MAG: thioredoxin reductase (NADPH) [Candidatus Endobugula sp.]|jgi:thioredoxin reductase (NADPH)